MNKINYLFNYVKYKTLNYKYFNLQLDKNKMDLIRLHNELDFFFVKYKNNKIILKEPLLSFGIINSIIELLSNFNTNDFINKKILSINNNVVILEILLLFLREHLNEKNITLILLPRYLSFSTNILYDDSYKIERVPEKINLDNVNIIKSKNLYIDDNLIENKKNTKYDILFFSLFNINSKYYKMINNVKSKTDKYIYLSLINIYYLCRIIKFIINNLNDNGNVIITLPGLLIENNTNIFSLLLENFLDYNIINNQEDLHFNLNTIFNITFHLKKYEPNKKIDDFNKLYINVEKKYERFIKNKINSIKELEELFYFDYKIKKNNELINKIKLYYDTMFKIYDKKINEINLIINNENLKNIIYEENIIKALYLAKKLNFDIKKKYNNKYILNYYNKLFSYLLSTNTNSHKIFNYHYKYEIDISKTDKNKYNWINNILKVYIDINNYIKINKNTTFKKINNDIEEYRNNKIKLNNLDLLPKSFELLQVLEISKIIDNYKNYNIFLINEYDGSYIKAIKHFMKEKNIKDYEWVAHISKCDSNYSVEDYQYSEDLYKLLLSKPKNYDFGINNGDLTKQETVNYYYKNYKKINLLFINTISTTSIDEFSDIIYLLRQFYSYILFMFKILNKHGSCVFTLDIDLLRYPLVMSIIALLTDKFDNIELYRSNYNLASKTFYIICNNYNKNINKYDFNLLYDFIKVFNPNYQIIQLNEVIDITRHDIHRGILKIIEDYVFNINRLNKFIINYNYLSDKEKNKIIKIIKDKI